MTPMRARIVAPATGDWDTAVAAVAKRQASTELAADVYFGAAYHAWHRKQGEPLGILVERETPLLFAGGLLHAVPEAPGVFDLQTPTGYGGPLVAAELSTDELEEAWAVASALFASLGVVAALFRLHPLLGWPSKLPRAARIIDDRVTVAVPLEQGAAAALLRADSRHRNMVGRSERQGVQVAWAEDATSDWDEFAHLYRAAMERLDARTELRFGPEYFEDMRTSGVAELATLRDGAALLAGAIFLSGPRYAHYHLSARRLDAPNYAMNRLVHAGVERACQRGLSSLHLGGGIRRDPDDALFRFKASVGSERCSFRLACVVTDEPMFQSLVQKREALLGRPSELLLGYRDSG